MILIKDVKVIEVDNVKNTAIEYMVTNPSIKVMLDVTGIKNANEALTHGSRLVNDKGNVVVIDNNPKLKALLNIQTNTYKRMERMLNDAVLERAKYAYEISSLEVKVNVREAEIADLKQQIHRHGTVSLVWAAAFVGLACLFFIGGLL